jgi:hypothetical protein
MESAKQPLNKCHTIETLTPHIGEKRAHEHSEGCKKCGVKVTPVVVTIDDKPAVEIVFDYKQYVSRSPDIFKYMKEGLFCGCQNQSKSNVPPMFKAFSLSNKVQSEIIITFGFITTNPDDIAKCIELCKAQKCSYFSVMNNTNMIININDTLYSTPVNDRLCQYLSTNSISTETLKNITKENVTFNGDWQLVFHKTTLNRLKNLNRSTFDAVIEMLDKQVSLKSIEVLLNNSGIGVQELLTVISLYYGIDKQWNIISKISYKNINAQFDSKWSIINHINRPSHEIITLYITALIDAIEKKSKALESLTTEFEVLLGKSFPEDTFGICGTLFTRLFTLKTPEAKATIKRLKPYL